jgi:hypothetical protein
VKHERWIWVVEQWHERWKMNWRRMCLPCRCTNLSCKHGKHATVVMIALIRRIRIERKKMMKKIVKEVLEELDRKTCEVQLQRSGRCGDRDRPRGEVSSSTRCSSRSRCVSARSSWRPTPRITLKQVKLTKDLYLIFYGSSKDIEWTRTCMHLGY